MTDGSNDNVPVVGAQNQSDPERSPDNVSFILRGDEQNFLPSFFPESVRVRKQRELDRQRGFCGGENVEDTGSKNKEVHVTGKLLGQNEKRGLINCGAHGGAFEMSSTTWTGSVYIKEYEIEGPLGQHPPTGSYLFDYTIDLVSAGEDEFDFDPENAPGPSFTPGFLGPQPLEDN